MKSWKIIWHDGFNNAYVYISVNCWPGAECARCNVEADDGQWGQILTCTVCRWTLRRVGRCFLPGNPEPHQDYWLGFEQRVLNLILIQVTFFFVLFQRRVFCGLMTWSEVRCGIEGIAIWFHHDHGWSGCGFFGDMGCQLVRSTRWLESQDTDGSHIKGLLLLGLEKGIFESRDICGFSQDVLIYVYLLIISVLKYL